jgi:hypothetical protein
MNLLKALIVSIVLIILTSCEKEDRVKLDDQYLYFEYVAINYAWGFQYVHWAIDRNGNILVNTNDDSIIQITENDIKYGNTSFDSAIYKVDQKELERYINLIPCASRGKIKCEDRNRADFGGISYSAFYRDRTILLSSMSDNEDCTNKNNDAVKIDKWLKDLHYKIYSK